MLRKDGVAVVAVDSTEPDLDHGQIGRGRYPWIEEQFAAEPSKLRIFVLHHHLLPVPGTGRERNVVYDAGDAIECLLRAGVHLVLSGHKHVPYAWRLENLFVVNTGHGFVPASPGKHEALLQRRRDQRQPRVDLAAASVPRGGADHPVLHRDVRVREVHRPDRAGGDDERMRRVVAIVDGEHYPPVVRAALEEIDDLVVAAVLVGGTEKLRGDGEGYGVPLEPLGRGGRRAPSARTSSSTSPTSPCSGRAERFALASRVLALGIPYEGPDFRFDPPPTSRSASRPSP